VQEGCEMDLVALKSVYLQLGGFVIGISVLYFAVNVLRRMYGR